MKNKILKPKLLQWSAHLPASDVADPLGLALRGSARLAERLLFCITSITPRARYFAFLPWCFSEHRKREKPYVHDLGLGEAIRIREQALTLGCIVHHEGQPCNGGALVGTQAAQNWLRRELDSAPLSKLKFTENPALNAYFNSMVQMHFFELDDANAVDTDGEESTTEPAFDDLELSPLGKAIAQAYDKAVGRLAATREVSEPSRICSLHHLAEFARRGGLCELTTEDAPDRTILRDVFLAQGDANAAGSHQLRRMSLLLLIEFSRQFSVVGEATNENNFAEAIYFGTFESDRKSVDVAIPSQLQDIAMRWRMFYFHHYMGVALEGIFTWLMNQLEDKGIAGEKLVDLAALLNDKNVKADLIEIGDIKINGSFGSITPADFFETIEIRVTSLDKNESQALDKKLSSLSPLSERSLEQYIRSGYYLQSATGLALNLLLLVTTLARYRQWIKSDYGLWLANAATDPYLDLIPPTLERGLCQHFGNWWHSSFFDLAKHVLSRYIVRQHITLSYDKSRAGDRCILQEDSEKIVAHGTFNKVGMGNVRLRSALQILEDLVLIEMNEEGITGPTSDGLQVLASALQFKEAA